jgi:hypothetical protein
MSEVHGHLRVEAELPARVDADLGVGVKTKPDTSSDVSTRASSPSAASTIRRVRR